MPKFKLFIYLSLVIILSFFRKIFLIIIFLVNLILKQFEKILFRIILFPFYKLYCSFVKKLRNEYPSPFIKNKFKYFLVNPRNIHFVIIICALIVVTHNIKAQDIQEENYKQRPLFFSLNKLAEEQIIEQGIPKLDVSETNHYPDALNYNQLFQKRREEGEILENFSFTNRGTAFLVSPDIDAHKKFIPPREEVEYYIVQTGDTISNIAEKYGLNQETILWENGLSSYSLIKPGQKLTILPIDGISYKVKKGDTLTKIAQKYGVKVEKISEYNKIAIDSALQSNQKLIIPGGRKPSAPRIQKTIRSTTRRIYYKNPKGGHIFPWGYCTWYVAQKRYVPWGGHAKYWLRNAQLYGFKIGKTPQVGAIIAIRESWWGHVGYVEAVGKNTVTFSEMNHRGRGIVSRRTFNINDRRIVGYIY